MNSGGLTLFFCPFFPWLLSAPDVLYSVFDRPSICQFWSTCSGLTQPFFFLSNVTCSLDGMKLNSILYNTSNPPRSSLCIKALLMTHSWGISSGEPWHDSINITLMERKSRMPQIQGVQRRSRSNLLRAFGNAGDGVSSAFPKGKQNGEKKELL